MSFIQDSLKDLATGSTAKIVCFGDSITDGYADFLEIILRTYLGNQNITVVNKGIAGDSAIKLINRVQTDVVNQSPDIVIVNSGQNDANINITCSKFKNDLDTLFDALGSYSCLVFGVTHRYLKNGNTTAQYYRDTLKLVADQRELPYSDAFGAFNELYKSGITDITTDGVHYDDIGNHFLASVIFRDLFAHDDLSIRKGESKDWRGNWFRLLTNMTYVDDGIVVTDGSVRLAIFIADKDPTLTIEFEGVRDVLIKGVIYTSTDIVERTDLVLGMNFITIKGTYKMKGISLS